MKNLFRGKVCVLVSAISAIVSMPLSAVTIYDNSSTFENATLMLENNKEVGDQIILGGSTLFRNVDTFAFQYWASSVDLIWNVQVKTKFYDQNGPTFNGFASPGTMLWESTWYSLARPTTPAMNNLLYSVGGGDFPSTGVGVPATTMTWSVEVQGLTGDDQFGLGLFTNPTTGNNYTDYWQYLSGSWQLATNSLVADSSFGATMTAVVPEPSSLALSILGGLGLMAWTRRMRNR